MARVTRGFFGRRREGADSSRVPPGQSVITDFPVLSAGPTPHTPEAEWSFGIDGEVEQSVSWTWREFLGLPREQFTVDIHCVTQWSKLDTRWSGVSIDKLLEGVTPRSEFVTAWSDGGYTTNLALEDMTNGRAWIVYAFDGKSLEAEHGGPARLLVPHLYLWKSAKWVRGLRFTASDQPGFWEGFGYHNHGDPWLEQRYQGD
jgi:DMSO/TMAO reductase YedYZ molybdopterin-dependent catalytic subunit